MKELVDSVLSSLKNKNWYSALIVSLILPDICGKIQYPNKRSQERYTEWFNHYLIDIYKGFLTANDCYALRCSYLHEGSDIIIEQRAREILDSIVFTTTPSHRNYVNLGGNKYLQLNVEKFCTDICIGVSKWLHDVADDSTIQGRISKLLKIYNFDIWLKPLMG